MVTSTAGTDFRRVVDLSNGRTVGAGTRSYANALPAWLRRPDARTGVLFLRVDIDGMAPGLAGHALFEGDVVAGERVVVGISEGDLLRSPGHVLELRDRVRARGWMTAIDEVGAEPRSLAMLPLLEPEIVVVDPSVVQRRAPESDRILDVVTTYARRSGAVILAAGVDTEEHRRRALSFGAHLGQGSLFGPPDADPPVTADTPVSAGIVPRLDWEIGTGGPSAPAQILDRHAEVAVGPLPTMLAASHRLEHRAAGSPDPSGVLLSVFQHQRRVGRKTASHYTDLAREVSFVGMLGVGMGAEPLPGVRGVALDPADPAADEWDVVVVTPSIEAALISREIAADRNGVRHFEYLLTEDSALVRQAARILLRRFSPRP